MRQSQRAGFWTAPSVVQSSPDYMPEACRLGPEEFGWAGNYATTVVIMIEEECAKDGAMPGPNPLKLNHSQGFDARGNLARAYHFACWKRSR